MIRRLLIANRGEIAVRIAAACREMGIEAVAVYSDADRASRHVSVADRTVHIGPSSAADSYLSIERLMGAARVSGADAVHPGYGFLSENAEFAAACEDAGLVFVGPSSSVIARMGSKIEARRAMQEAGLPVVPGETPSEQSDDGLRQAVVRVGLPALVKASAGGGGKGMRRIDSMAEVLEAVQSARREALAAFGDGELYVERLLERPRHVEVQVFGDAHGHYVHLFERECSVQRRHQKVIEESPCAWLDPALRERMTAAAVQAARAVSYRNAGTIEFLVERSSFYFLEMNTRLQVEHPVTELVTGVDMVRAQLLVASGEVLPWTQHELVQRGHAVEARLYAEDPAHEFLPAAGRLLMYREPRRPGLRIDSGVREGQEVSVYYDPMLAKVVAFAESRPLAIARLVSALRDFPVLGLSTNLPFLIRVLEHPRFAAGDVDTTFLDTEGASLASADADRPPTEVVTAAMAEHRRMTSQTPGDRSSISGWDPWSTLARWTI